MTGLRRPTHRPDAPSAGPRRRAAVRAGAAAVAAVACGIVGARTGLLAGAVAALPAGAVAFVAPSRWRRVVVPARLAGFSGAPDLMAVCDADGTFLRVSPSSAEILGRPPEELIGTRMQDLAHPEDVPVVARLFAPDAAGPVLRTPDHRLRHADGHWVWIETTARVTREPGGPVRGAVTSSRDVSERRVVEDALRRSERRFRALVSDAPVGIAEMDRSGGCVYVNETWSQMTAQDPVDAVGEGWLRAVHPDDRAAVGGDWVRTIGGDAPGRGEFRVRTPDGGVRWVSSRWTPITDDGGPATGYLTTIVDVTDRRGL